jgi:hypothetical protein
MIVGTYLVAATADVGSVFRDNSISGEDNRVDLYRLWEGKKYRRIYHIEYFMRMVDNKRYWRVSDITRILWLGE